MSRPKGAKNKQYKKEVDEFPTTCPHCESESIKQLEGRVPRLESQGTTPDGKSYRAIEWRRMTCNDCHRFFSKKTYRPALPKTHSPSKN